MATFNYVIADPTFTYNDGSADSTANNEGWVVINGSTIRIMNDRTPSTSSDPGYKGEICYDTNYLYICISTNTWKRIALSSF
jgi:hypothetical protein